jgi:hypothetical protein
MNPNSLRDQVLLRMAGARACDFVRCVVKRRREERCIYCSLCITLTNNILRSRARTPAHLNLPAIASLFHNFNTSDSPQSRTLIKVEAVIHQPITDTPSEPRLTYTINGHDLPMMTQAPTNDWPHYHHPIHVSYLIAIVLTLRALSSNAQPRSTATPLLLPLLVPTGSPTAAQKASEQ